MESPLQLSRDNFIKGFANEEVKKNPPQKGRAQTVTFTLNNLDLEVLEQQIDRATSLKKRNKSKSAIIRMALRALSSSSDDEYSMLHDKF